MQPTAGQLLENPFPSDMQATADSPRYALDYVMCRPADRWQVVEVRMLDNEAMLYHLPMVAVLRRVEEK